MFCCSQTVTAWSGSWLNFSTVLAACCRGHGWVNSECCQKRHPAQPGKYGMRIVELIGTLPPVNALSGAALRQYQQQLRAEREQCVEQARQARLAQRREQQRKDSEWRKRHAGKGLVWSKKAKRNTRTRRNARQA